MSYLVIARKWRPQTFEEIIGQQHVTQTLSNAIRTNRVAHAFLFTGVRGVGKTTAARVLAKALNCEKGATAQPCNECANCREITSGSSVDVLEVDGASNTGVDDVREIIENVRYQPAKSRHKIYIIDEVHMLSTSAFNALLKTLEEPPAHVKFIFATTDPHKVPRTIHSRCQRYDFKRISLRLIADQLQAIVRKDGVEAEPNALLLIAREAEGSMRDAQSLLDQVLAFAGNKLTTDDAVKALGLADRAQVRRLADAIVTRQPGAAVTVLDELYSYGYDLRRLARDLLEHFRNLATAKVAPSSEILNELPDDERSELERQAKTISSEDLDRCFRVLLDTEAEIARVPYPKLIFDMAVLKLANLPPLLSAEELLGAIDAARDQIGRPGGVSSFAAAPSPPSAIRPERSAPATKAGAPVTARDSAPSAPASNGPVSWEGFLEFVGKNKITLLTYLQASPPPDIEANTLQLTVPPGYYLDYLTQKDHLAMVEELAARYFGRRLGVTVNAGQANAPTKKLDSGPSPAELHAQAVGDPKVQAALEILGGEIKEVRSRRKPVEDNT